MMQDNRPCARELGVQACTEKEVLAVRHLHDVCDVCCCCWHSGD